MNENHIEEGLDHINLWMTKVKLLSDHMKKRYNYKKRTQKQLSKIFIDKKLALKVIMHCKATSNYELRLGFQ